MGVTTLLIFTAVESTPYEASQHGYFASQILLRLEREKIVNNDVHQLTIFPYISNFAYCYGLDFLIQLAFCYPSLGTFLFSITSFYSA